MLDPVAPFHVPEVPGVTVYPDHANPARFYAVPDQPRIARDERGRPQLSLLVYGRGPGAVTPLGGQLTLTATLALGASERERLVAALEGRLAAGSLPPGVTLISPEWLDGEIHAHLAPGVELTGQPSLMGANEGTLSLTLTPEGASALRRAWADGLPGATLRYQLTTRAAEREETSAAAQQSAYDDALRSFAQMSARMSTARAIRLPLTLEGPLGLTRGELQTTLQVTTL